ncbi:MAG: hypothetical protein RLZZ384_281, partial [Pseudomonadota bacterium]
GGKSIGQSAPVQKQAQPAQAQKPAQQAQPAAPAAGNAAAAAPKRPGFGGMLGGLAAGLGIAYLLSHFGLGEAAASMFTGILIALAVGLLLLFILKRFMPSMSGAGRTSPAAAGNNGMQRTAYEHGNTTRNEPGFVPVAASFGGAAAVVPEAAKSLPAGFDEYAFLDNAKHYFVKLQKAWDERDFAEIRGLTSDKVFAEIQDQLKSSTDINKTDILKLEAEILEVRDLTSEFEAVVLFDTIMRESEHEHPNQVREVWHFVKSKSGFQSNWILDGIQQLED